MICPSCSAEIPTGGRFCPQCAAPAPANEKPTDPVMAALDAAIGFQYRIVRLLGRGGMGSVYLAQELALGREVAIKVLPPEAEATPDRRERFRREARTAARLSHPNIVPLLTFGEVHGLVYFVMGYVPGESLAARLRREGRVEAGEARRILAEIAGALAYAHGQGVVHRDLKPDNVLLDAKSGRPLLADFGIAKAAGTGQTLTATGAIVGTPTYMSPEQAGGRPDVDARSDLYSLGVMGYEMLAGRAPFEGKSSGEILVQHMTREPPPLASAAQGAPTDLVNALMRCLAKDPGARWPGADALREALRERETDDSEPRVLREVSQGIGVFLANCLVTACLWLHRWAADDTGYGFLGAFSWIMPIVACGLLLLPLVAARSDGRDWAATRRAAILQPRWWWAWYPRSLRRPGDVWDRLPPEARRQRNVLGVLALYLALFMLPTVVVQSAPDDRYERSGRRSAISSRLRGIQMAIKDVVGPGAMLLGAAAMIGSILWERALVRRLGAQAKLQLDRESPFAPLFLSTADRGWMRPPLAQLLEPETQAPEAASAPGALDGLQAALTRLAGAAPEAQRDLVQRAAATARRLRDSVASIDVSVSALEKDRDQGEIQRLESRRAGLGPASSTEAPERQRLRELLDGQLQLARDLESRLESLRAERARRLGLLQDLWRDADSLTRNASSPEARQRLEIACLGAERAASADTALPGPATPDVSDLPTLDR